MKTLSEALRQARGNRSFYEFGTVVGINPATLKSWEEGKTVPKREDAVHKVGDLLGWDDETRISYMKVLRCTGIIKKAANRRRLLRLEQREAAELLGVHRQTLNGWEQGATSEKAKETAQKFLDMSESEIYQKLMAKNKRDRVEINYELIHKLDKKYGDSSGGGPQNAPEDDPDLLQLQREMNREW